MTLSWEDSIAEDSIVNVCRSAGPTRGWGTIRTARRSDRLYRPGCQSGHAPGGGPTFDASLIPARVNPPGEQDLAGWLAKCCDRRSSKAGNAACGQANEAPATARERASIEQAAICSQFKGSGAV